MQTVEDLIGKTIEVVNANDYRLVVRINGKLYSIEIVSDCTPLGPSYIDEDELDCEIESWLTLIPYKEGDGNEAST